MFERERLVNLHGRIGACTLCRELLDPTKALRVSSAGPLHSPVFIVSQALADATQRRSGIPYFLPTGKLSPTGTRLEQFLNQVECTLYPPVNITLPGGSIEARPRLQQVYNSEIIQCFPGRVGAGKGDQFPREVARRCLEQRYLEHEIALVNPIVILVLGGKAGQAFLDAFDHAFGRLPPIGRTLLPFDPKVAFRSVVAGGTRRIAVVLVHPSGMTAGKFQRYVSGNTSLCHELRQIVYGQVR